MHPTLIIALVAGLVMKLLHLPYHTVVLLIVVMLGLGTSVSGLRGDQGSQAWCRLAFWTWLLHLVALLKLFPFRMVTLILAAVITVIAVFMVLRQRPLPNALRQLAGAFILVMLVMAVPTADRYHFTNLRFSLERDGDFVSWDKYSFFLAREGRTSEALEANGAAVEAAMMSHDDAAAALLRVRREAIERNTWEHYTPLSHGH